MALTDDVIIKWTKDKLTAEHPEFAPGGQYADCWATARWEIRRLPSTFKYAVVVVLPIVPTTIHVQVTKEQLHDR